ncbi:DUF1513 domain-containing protein [Gynuella sunshinyii]|uniref:DUF1513 domain-containing protein n=1 Tax=Gynuella sunshinyii YC6258 TaxID=1445510 RepID=A0A0C5VTW8_9GAMM|nr:DUF1513 domain-containing protein [Gynuella sunshinyii]AJQ96733.1 hypothetical protein YC6258_04701 [Gynuella sunshinyii YC6258]
MAINRRDFIKVAALAGLSWHTLATDMSGDQQKRVLGVIKTADGQWSAVCFDLTAGRVIYRIPLPGRAHGSASVAHEVAALVARRPGAFVIVFEPDTGRVIHRLKAPQGHVFNGHVVFTDHAMHVSGEKLGSSDGVLFHYERKSWSLRDVVPLNGLGPHEILLHSPDYLVAGIGGLRTAGREVLNQNTMQPSLLCVHPVTGKEHWRLAPVDHLLSTRHLTLTDNGHAVIAMQYQSDIPQTLPLLAITDRPVDQQPQQLLPFEASDLDWMNFKNYIGSVASCGHQIVASSPRGHRVGVWDASSRAFQYSDYIQDVCPLASDGQRWWAGSGVGLIRADDQTASRQTGLRWDNHWSFIQF